MDLDTMQLLSTYSHMPFLHGEVLYFCHSDGAKEFHVPQTDRALELKLPAQVLTYQPWQLARLTNGQIERLPINLPIVSPRHVICNPVIEGDQLSFVYNKGIYTAPLSDLTSPTLAKDNIYTGFVTPTRTVWADSKSGTFFLTADQSEPYETPLDHICRLVPSGEGFLATGSLEGVFRTFRCFPNGLTKEIRVNSKPVYKCCLSGETVIHAVRSDGFEDRYLHQDTFELW